MLAAPRQPVDRMASHRHTSSYTGGLSTAYAIPAQRTYGRDGDARGEGLSFAEHEMLRSRKTPYGRIHEEHDTMFADRNVYVPASKHVLLSVSPSTPITYQKHAHRSGYASRTPDSVWNASEFHRNAALDRAQSGVDLSRLGGANPSGVDSVLHQTMNGPDQRHYYHPGSQVPTVLPSAFHTHTGPTASAGQQCYGPYWPDGTFNPYRPAPIRDSRFYDHGADLSFMPQGVSLDDRMLRRSAGLPAFQDFRSGFHYFEPAHYKSTPGLLPFSDRVFGASANANGNKSSPYQHNVTGSDPTDATQDLYNSEPFTGKDLEIVSHRSNLYHSEESDKIAYRDRIFAWAHQIYVELLAKIQREHKLGRPVQNYPGQAKMVIKPIIFPKPPQRSGSHFKDYTVAVQKDPLFSGRDDRTGDWLDQDGVVTDRPQTAFRSSPGKSLDYTVPGHAQSDRTTRLVRNQPQQTDRPQLSRIPSLRLSQPYDRSYQTPIHSAAQSALDTMEMICGGAVLPWTDGMLLAGCLAYGLGNYGKALSWYQKVLTQDSEHVEAISNMAATLLALGKREDALQYWQAAVKLRPSYFEAVEHLIGLLCTAQRGKDAVEVIEFVESRLKSPASKERQFHDTSSDGESDAQSRSSSLTTVSNDRGVFEYDTERRTSTSSANLDQRAAGFGSSGYNIPGSDNGRLLALIHAKGNMLYGLGNNDSAAAAFEDAILIATGHRQSGIEGLIRRILQSCVSHTDGYPSTILQPTNKEPILLSPERAQQTAQRMFPSNGELPGLGYVSRGLAYKAAISTTSNSLLSLAKIYQDGLGNTGVKVGTRANGTREILALYYLSLSLQRSPSTANNVGILLASVQQTTNHAQTASLTFSNRIVNCVGIAPNSGSALALQYYNYGLNLDPKHAHLYTNLGSLLKDLGQLSSAIKMYEIAVQCDGNFDIALANLANAVKDQGRIMDAITYYRRAVQVNPEFAEAVCGLATALNSVCNWYGRGGVHADGGSRDRIHVDEYGMMQEARKGSGWMNRVVEIVDKQLKEGEHWGQGTLTPNVIKYLSQQLLISKSHLPEEDQQRFYQQVYNALQSWSRKKWEGARIVRLVERATRQIGWQWYRDRYLLGKEYPSKRYARPTFPVTLSSPTAPTVLPFHTFTTPLSAKQVRQISQRNALRISVSALRSPWLPLTVYPPPPPPSPCLNVGYVSSDFNNHPLAHLMQSIFGLHDISRVKAFCYATTSSDGSVHRQQIESEAPVFYDASSWNVERLVERVVRDNIHVLVNLNGYTRGARNEVFAARPAPIHMSFMGFAGTLGAEWCDYVFADPISILPETLAPRRENVSIEDRLHPEALVEDKEDWIYAENVIFSKSTFFCVDHKQSAPDAEAGPPLLRSPTARETAWKAEQDRRWQLRKELFPMLSDSAVILGNFNQLYKIDPSTFRMYLRILDRVRNAILWLLRFPDIGEQNLKSFAREWAGEEVASRVVFTDVAPKGAHIMRASVVDLFLDTPECNAHTTAADVLWSGTPIVTWARWDYKMCSRMASSIVASALPEDANGDDARRDLLVSSDEQYEKHAISLASTLRYPGGNGFAGRGHGRLMELRKTLWEGRWTSRLFDTKRWVKNLETAYWTAWGKWERGEGGDIWL